MMFMLDLMSSCTDAFFLKYPKMALLPPDRGTNFLIWKQIGQVEGDSHSPGRGTIFY